MKKQIMNFIHFQFVYKTIFNFKVKDSSINKVYPTEGKKFKYFLKIIMILLKKLIILV